MVFVVLVCFCTRVGPLLLFLGREEFSVLVQRVCKYTHTHCSTICQHKTSSDLCQQFLTPRVPVIRCALKAGKCVCVFLGRICAGSYANHPKIGAAATLRGSRTQAPDVDMRQPPSQTSSAHDRQIQPDFRLGPGFAAFEICLDFEVVPGFEFPRCPGPAP